jgi:cyclic lactone autoinducer peptide
VGAENNKKEETALKKDFAKANKLIAKAALAVTKSNANATCAFLIHQPKMPEAAKKLRKF